MAGGLAPGCDGLAGALGGRDTGGGCGSSLRMGIGLLGGACLRVVGGEGWSYLEDDGDMGGEGMKSPDMGWAFTMVISGL